MHTALIRIAGMKLAYSKFYEKGPGVVKKGKINSGSL